MDFPLFDPKQKYFPETLVSDLGEGIDLSNRKVKRQIYFGNVDFWAPEVKRFREYSPSSDMYALGCLFRCMIEKKWAIDVERGGERGMLPVCS
jgi:serine/threonine protein kinase